MRQVRALDRRARLVMRVLALDCGWASNAQAGLGDAGPYCPNTRATPWPCSGATAMPWATSMQGTP